MKTTGSGLRIGELADAADVTTDTVRFYERKELLLAPRRTSSGYRVYDRGTVERLKFIRKAQRMGFSLNQIKVILSERDRGAAPCASVIDMTRRRLREVEEELNRLKKTRSSLSRYLKEWAGSDSATCCATEEFCSLIARTEV